MYSNLKNIQIYMGMICDALTDRDLYKDVLTEEYKEILVKVSPFFDVGKIRVPETILQKDGALTEEEFSISRSHTRLGADILENMLRDYLEEDILKAARDMALYHHERWNGTGFPEGLSGENIPLSARMIAVAIALNKLCLEYLGKENDHGEDDIFAIMREYAGTQLDPDIVSAFLTREDELRMSIKEEGAL